MEWVEAIAEELKQQDISFAAYLPDSKISPLVTRLENDDDFETVLVTREEECMGILAGAWFGGKKGVLICQTDGLATTFNALGSFIKPTRIPFLALISRRGNLGEHNHAHVPSGYNMPRLLETIGFRAKCVDEGDDVREQVAQASKTTFSTEEPYFLLLETTLTEDN